MVASHLSPLNANVRPYREPRYLDLSRRVQCNVSRSRFCALTLEVENSCKNQLEYFTDDIMDVSFEPGRDQQAEQSHHLAEGQNPHLLDLLLACEDSSRRTSHRLISQTVWLKLSGPGNQLCEQPLTP
eukprot:806045-Pelagomonas_calceolata.AAC.14